MPTDTATTTGSLTPLGDQVFVNLYTRYNDAIPTFGPAKTPPSQPLPSYKHQLDQISNRLSSISDKQSWTNLLSAGNLAVSIGSCYLLFRIHEQLQDAGLQLQQAAGSLDRQEAMHRAHYDVLKRERNLKEAIYTIGKYQKQAAQDHDSISRAYSGKVLLDLLKGHNFSTADVGDLADKEFFDARCQDALDGVSQLSSDQQDELAKFENLYALHTQTLAADPEKLLPAPLQPSPLVSRDAYAARYWPSFQFLNQAYSTERTRALAWKLDELRQILQGGAQLRWRRTRRALFLALGIFFVITLPLGILSILYDLRTAEGKTTMLGWFISAIVLLWAGFILWFWFLRHQEPAAQARRSICDEYNIPLERFPELERDYKLHARECADFMAQVDNVVEGINQQSKQNSEANRNRERQLKQLQEGRRKFLLEAAAAINAFLDAHPTLTEWFPRPSAQAHTAKLGGA